MKTNQRTSEQKFDDENDNKFSSNNRLKMEVKVSQQTTGQAWKIVALQSLGCKSIYVTSPP